MCRVNKLFIILHFYFIYRQHVLTFMSVMAVSVNAGMIVFTMSVLDDWTTSGKYWIFIGFQAFGFLTQVRFCAFCVHMY